METSTRSNTYQMDRPTPARQQQCSHCNSEEANHWSRSLKSDATVQADYALTSGNDIGVIFVDVHRVFDIHRVPEGEFDRLRSNFDYYCQLHQAYQTVVLCYWVVRSSVVELYYCVFVDLCEVTTKTAIF